MHVGKVSKEVLMKQSYFICDNCKNIINIVHSSGNPLVCCGQKMTEIEGNTTDAAFEKHIPAVTQSGDKLTVNVGSILHPMTAEHLIEWVSVETNKGVHRMHFVAEGTPSVCVTLGERETLECVSAYCNLHGLWSYCP